MKYFVIALIFFLVFFIAMGIGFLISGKKLAGSCGGIGKLLGRDCDFCESRDECESSR